QLAGTQVELQPYRYASVPDGQSVDRGKQFAFREIERGHHDRAAIAGGPLGGRRRRLLARGEQRERQERRRQGGKATTPSGCPSRQHVTSFTAPSRRCQDLPLITAVHR